MHFSYLKPDWEQITALVKIAALGVFQFVIASCSWIFLAQLVATTGGDTGSAGYQTALRIMMFFMLPAWGLSNAAATLVGQNLGAKQLDRAQKAVIQTIKYIVIFMVTVCVFTLSGASTIISFFSNDATVQEVAVTAIRIMSLGFVIYGVGMVLVSTFNGAGDTWTPTRINFLGFWLFQIPLAYLLAKYLELGPLGVFIAIPVSETVICLMSYIVFRKGAWKAIKV